MRLGKVKESFDSWEYVVEVAGDDGTLCGRARVSEEALEEDATSGPRMWDRMLPARRKGDTHMWRMLETPGDRWRRCWVDDWWAEYIAELRVRNQAEAAKVEAEEKALEDRERLRERMLRIGRAKMQKLVKECGGRRSPADKVAELWRAAEIEAREQGGGK